MILSENYIIFASENNFNHVCPQEKALASSLWLSQKLTND